MPRAKAPEKVKRVRPAEMEKRFEEAFLHYFEAPAVENPRGESFGLATLLP